MRILLKFQISVLVSFFFVLNCQAEKSEDQTTFLLLPLLTQRSSTGTTSSTPSTTTSSFNYSFSTAPTTGVASSSVSFTVRINPGQRGTVTHRLFFSTDSTITPSDTEVGSYAFNDSSQNDQNITIASIPSALQSPTAGTPRQIFYEFLATGETSKTSFSSFVLFPTGSILGSSLTSTSSVTSLATADYAFFPVSSFGTNTRLTLSGFTVTGGLNIALVLFNGTTFATIGSEVNANGSNQFEFGSYLVTGSQTNYLRIRKVSGSGTFIASRMVSNFPPSVSFSTPSCNGGTSAFANRCVDYLDANPGNSTVCATLQGTGSVYSASQCSNTSRIARCFGNPLFQDSRAVINFYSPETTGTASTVCGGDVLTTP